MKIIYDSEGIYENGEDESLGRFHAEEIDLEKEKKAVPKEKKAPMPQPSPQSQQNIQYTQTPYGVPYNATVPLTPEQFNFMMAQLSAMQPPVEGAYQPGMPVYGQCYPYMPYQPPVPPVQPPQSDGSPDPGTRVVFQSADFDAPEGASAPAGQMPYPYVPYQMPAYQPYIPAEPQPQPQNPTAPVKAEQPARVDEDIIPFKGFVVPDEVKNTSPFSVDETQISMFELDAMAKKKKAPEVKQTIGSFTAEEEEFYVEQDDTEKAQTEGGEKKKLPTAEIIRRAILAIALVAIVVSAGMLINEYRLSQQNDALVDEVSDLIIEEPKKDKDKNKGDGKDVTEKELSEAEQWAKLKKDYPNVSFPEGLQLKYAKLYAANQEFVGYLSADGVNLNLPIVQTTNDSKYLTKNFYLQNTKYGCPFVTHLNNITTKDSLDQNTVIFGHHMNNGTIFGALDAYKSIEGFKKAPLITFDTLYNDYSWKVIAAFVTNAYAKDDNGYIFRYYFTQLSSQENFSAFLSELAQRSLYDTGVDVLPTDKLLTLSTCSHEFTDARFVVVARLVRPGESEDVDTSRATVNSNPRYPQAWYNKKGKTNPYKNSFQWEVS